MPFVHHTRALPSLDASLLDTRHGGTPASKPTAQSLTDAPVTYARVTWQDQPRWAEVVGGGRQFQDGYQPRNRHETRGAKMCRFYLQVSLRERDI